MISRLRQFLRLMMAFVYRAKGVYVTEKNTIQLVPNKWVSEEVLMAITGLTKNAIKSARSKSWMEGCEYRHYAGDCHPSDNSPILYNRYEIDNWVERQHPAKPRQFK